MHGRRGARSSTESNVLRRQQRGRAAEGASGNLRLVIDNKAISKFVTFRVCPQFRRPFGGVAEGCNDIGDGAGSSSTDHSHSHLIVLAAPGRSLRSRRTICCRRNHGVWNATLAMGSTSAVRMPIFCPSISPRYRWIDRRHRLHRQRDAPQDHDRPPVSRGRIVAARHGDMGGLNLEGLGARPNARALDRRHAEYRHPRSRLLVDPAGPCRHNHQLQRC